MNRTVVSYVILAVGGSMFAACSSYEAAESTATRTEARTGTTAQAIKGGTDTTNYPFVVGVNIGGNGTCSGTLIAPNLVLTARHCVSQISTGENIECGKSVFTSTYPARTFGVTTSPTMYTGNPTFRGVSKVTTPSGNVTCGADLALLQLSSNVPASEATPAAPLIGHTLYNQTLYSAALAAIGYGLTDSQAVAPNSSGVRRIRQNITILCLIGRPDSECGIQDGVLDKNDMLTSEGTCQGDSGSASFEQDLFNKGVYLATGVLSRGDGACSSSIYTRTDAWSDFLVSNALSAATAGGYTAPAWTSPPAPTAADAPVVKTTKDAGTKDTGITTPSTSKLGAACTVNDTCASKQCVAPSADSAFVCAQACTNQVACPSGFVCSDSYCFAGDPVPDAGSSANTALAASSGGCSVTPYSAKDPTKPIPWRAAPFAGLTGLVALIWRRRRNDV